MSRDQEKLERPRLATRRLLLQPLRPRHAEMVFAAVDAERRTLRRWMPWVDATRSSADSLEFIRRSGRSPTEIVLGIWQTDAGGLRYCGNLGLAGVSRFQGTAMLGYWVRRSRAGRGVATEASAAVLLWAFGMLRLERVDIAAATGNAASLRVIDKLGFVREGLMRKAQRIPGRRNRVDWVRAGMIRSDLPDVRAGLAEYCGTRRPWVSRS